MKEKEIECLDNCGSYDSGYCYCLEKPLSEKEAEECSLGCIVYRINWEEDIIDKIKNGESLTNEEFHSLISNERYIVESKIDKNSSAKISSIINIQNKYFQIDWVKGDDPLKDIFNSAHVVHKN